MMIEFKELRVEIEWDWNHARNANPLRVTKKVVRLFRIEVGI